MIVVNEKVAVGAAGVTWGGERLAGGVNFTLPVLPVVFNAGEVATTAAGEPAWCAFSMARLPKWKASSCAVVEAKICCPAVVCFKAHEVVSACGVSADVAQHHVSWTGSIARH